ncbi:MAG TPA: NADPH:quinone oxidoreductase family protein [Acidimicrobiales bacterium]
MRAVVCEHLGPLADLVIEERQPLLPRQGEVAVDVRAAGVNYVDGLICEGRYQLKPRTPFVPGGEIAGVVSAVGGGVTGVAPGDRVMAMTGFGGFAEQVVLPALSVLPMPDGLGFGPAAAMIQSYATARFTLTRRTSLRAGEWLLVLGAGGGIGLATVDVGVSLGARVIAAASSPPKLDAAVAMGAEATIAYEEEDLKVRARELSGGGVDVVVDPVGGRHSEPALRATRAGGRFCVVGFAGGAIPSLPLNQVLLNNRTVVGVDWGAWALGDGEGNRALIAEVADLVSQGRLHPTVPAERPLVDAAAVMGGLIDRSVVGKVVLVP